MHPSINNKRLLGAISVCGWAVPHVALGARVSCTCRIVYNTYGVDWPYLSGIQACQACRPPAPRSAHMSLADNFSLDELTQRCASETEKFGRREPSDARFCFELLRRALADGLSDAFTRVYQIYERQVLIWVHSHSGFAHSGESADYFVSTAWSTFYFAL